MDSFPTSSGEEDFHHDNGKGEGLDVGLWSGRILGWDGLLPAIVLLASMAVALFFPKNQGVQSVALLALPIAAFLWRAYVGHRQIYTNRCGRWVRRGQRVALGFALLLFVAFDFIFVLLQFVPKGQRQLPPEDVPIWAGLAVAYFALVAFAMYPGRGPTSRCS
jgi:hypothetical protein